jgi:hypothetical protein
MPSVLDLWRVLDPDARRVAGPEGGLRRPVLGLERTRAAPPHLPLLPAGAILLADGELLRVTGLPTLLSAVLEANLEPAAVVIAGNQTTVDDAVEPSVPVLVSTQPISPLFARAQSYLADEGAFLAAARLELRLAFAEAALADPAPAVPAGLASARLRRGVAISDGGALRSLHARSAGQALAARFAAAHARLFGTPQSTSRRSADRQVDGLWILEGRINESSSAWLFDDLPFAAIDHTGLDALTTTLRALLRRPAGPPTPQRRARPPAASGHSPDSGDDTLAATLLAVARANGRIAPAARALGVHRNTVLYRLKRGAFELGLDPRRADDAWAIIERAERSPRQ